MQTKTKEIVIVSGKGGTGKTSISAALTSLLQGQVVIADCDVDAANLHILLQPKIQTEQPFKAGYQAKIRQSECTGCGLCAQKCRFEAIIHRQDDSFQVDPIFCEGCGVCVYFCPEKAIDFVQQECGKWMLSTTKYGPMAHAHLHIGAENSGKLVSLVRRQAKELAQQNAKEYVLVDGPPGIGCPVIAALTGADVAVIVVEPTLSGLHDLQRIFRLIKHFKLPAGIIVNKWDLNPALTTQIKDFTTKHQESFLGQIPYHQDFATALAELTPITEYKPEYQDTFADILRQILDLANSKNKSKITIGRL